MNNRIDKELVIRNLVNTRSKAQELIDNGYVYCNGKQITKDSYKVSESDELSIKDNEILKYVSRGGLKLEKAINKFKISFKDKIIMDIGSSTGGFTDCSLKHGAKQVISIDVGTNLMDNELRKDKRISLFEQTNIKDLDSKYFKNIDIIVTDVSFISIKKIIDKIYKEKIKIDLVCLIKPQFECGKEIADKYKGIILDKDVHKEILKDIISYFSYLGFNLINIDYSPIRGKDGNIEYVSYFSNKKEISNSFDIDSLVELSFKNK